LAFPATQVASSNVNVLDDYEEGTWTPAITFATPGDLSVAYSTQNGGYTKIGNTVMLDFNIQTSSFTHTTASGDVRVSGLPFTAGGAYPGSVIFSGVTKATYTDLAPIATNQNTYLIVQAGGSGVATSTVKAADMPTAGTIIFQGTVTYKV